LKYRSREIVCTILYFQRISRLAIIVLFLYQFMECCSQV